ncbi:LysM peptidoglycan-binding domain-containing protein [Fusobacterium perfoetens]|uniref:LysM peptidoglycan-binding domain-containing protein n=1 Tax=Fusobacterium perfoetens TaxID=852 RepID=UPI0026EC78A9|nr:LysM peptidoglycan-binding domain-containing protein [Fusobacterium perfoetens]
MKKIIYLLMILLVGCTAIEEKEDSPIIYDLAIVSTNNINGKIQEGIGYPRLATIIKDKEREHGKEKVLYLDAGGNFSGSNFSESTKGAGVAKVLNGVGLKVTTLGKGDFYYGAERIKELEKISNFKIVASNVKYRDGRDFVKPYLLGRAGNKRFAIIGIVSPELYSEIMDKKTKGELIIQEPILVIPNLVRLIKENNIDFIIALSSFGENTEWNATELAKNIPGIDLMVVSGQGKAMNQKMNNTYIIKEENSFGSIGVTKVDLKADKKSLNRIVHEKLKLSDIYIPENERKTTKESTIKEEITKGEDIYYKVQPGNTLYSLAREYNTTVDEIKRLNPNIEGNNIKVGETYKILEKKVDIIEKKVETETNKAKEMYENFDSIAVEMNDMENIPDNALEVGKIDIPKDIEVEKLIETLK